ncbi:MAG TPA: hypothetical protein GXX49_08775 [Clostridiaceae bacterium]|nr:hypothetical protein [Clostridiaceae bacterium]
MNSIYNSTLHKFVEIYLKLTGGKILEINDDFFVVLLADGTKVFYTYSPRIAAENKEMTLIAKGSKLLQKMIRECSLKSAFSEVAVKNTERSIKSALEKKCCCDLCPFSTVCENHDECCYYCHYYKNCNTNIENAEFIGTKTIKKTEEANLILFMFLVEISNDYSLSQKVSKTVPVLIDLETGEVIDDLLVNDIDSLDLANCEESIMIDNGNYVKILNNARKVASKIVSRHLEVFRKNIEDVLGGKITSIISKFEEEYVDTYTTSTLEQLQEMQEEALKLCEREIRGYTINCDYHLKSVNILHAKRDIRDIIVRHNHTGKELLVEADVLLSKVDIKCSQCGMEIDRAVICENGHVLCRNCMEVCSICNKVICDVCEGESYVCSTCGEIVCEDCYVKCSKCDSLQCKSHIYECAVCGEKLCVDCYEICKECDESLCKDHFVYCGNCGDPVCLEHASKCSICGRLFCHEHTEKCQVCNEFICDEDTNYSAYSGRAVCGRHLVKCEVCEDNFAEDEIKECTVCKEKLCPNHIKTCNKCSRVYCSSHVNYCRSCGKEYCECTSFVKCKFCGEDYCDNCIDKNGYCKTCSELEPVTGKDPELDSIFKYVPELGNYKKFYLGKSEEIRVLYAKGFFRNLLVVYNNSGAVLSTREVSFLENLKRKNRITKRGKI